MFVPDVCHLTTTDYTTLEIMQHNPVGNELMTILRHKLSRAIVMHQDQIPPTVAVTGSEVTYRVDDSPAETRMLAGREFHGLDRFLPVLPISHPRGLAMLGLSEGARACLCPDDGPSETLTVLRVVQQPEAAHAAADQSRTMAGVHRPAPE